MTSQILTAKTLDDFFDKPLRQLVPSDVPRHYICSLLVGLSHKAFRTIEPGESYAERVMEILGSTDALRAAIEMRHIGDTLLIGCGLYPEEIMHNSERTGKPGVDYFMDIGSNAYGATASISKKRRVLFGMHNPDLFAHLSDEFPQFVGVLRRLKQTLFVESDQLRHLLIFPDRIIEQRDYCSDTQDYSVEIDDALIVGIDLNSKN